MKFVLEFPDSCYNEDKKHYDLFVNALQMMLNRMAMSHNKYQKGRPMNEVVEAIDEIKSAVQRLSMYDNRLLGTLGCNCGPAPYQECAPNCFLNLKKVNTGNTENLLDAANMLVIEFIFPKHPKAKFKAQTSADSPGLEYLP